MDSASDERPRDMPAISFRVPAALLAAAAAIAAEEGITMSAVARRALIRDLRERSGADA